MTDSGYPAQVRLAPDSDQVADIKASRLVPDSAVSICSKEVERDRGTDEGGGETAVGSVQDPAPEADITIQRRKRAREREEKPERSARTRRVAHDNDGDDPSPDHPPRSRPDRDLDRGWWQ